MCQAHHGPKVAGAVQQQARCDAACAAHPARVPPPFGPARPRAALAPALRVPRPPHGGPVAGAGGRRARFRTPPAAPSRARAPARARGGRRSTPPALLREHQGDAVGVHDGARRAREFEHDAAVRLEPPPHLLLRLRSLVTWVRTKHRGCWHTAYDVMGRKLISCKKSTLEKTSRATGRLTLDESCAATPPCTACPSSRSAGAQHPTCPTRIIGTLADRGEGAPWR